MHSFAKYPQRLTSLSIVTFSCRTRCRGHKLFLPLFVFFFSFFVPRSFSSCQTQHAGAHANGHLAFLQIHASNEYGEFDKVNVRAAYHF